MVRVDLDVRNEKVGFKIREAEVQKVPYMLVVGDKEMESGQVSVRHHGEGDRGAMSVDDFVNLIVTEIAQKK